VADKTGTNNPGIYWEYIWIISNNILFIIYMKILHIGKWYPWNGGVETVRNDIVNGISAMGINCDMLCEAPLGCKRAEYNLNAHCKVVTVKTLFRLIRVPIAPRIIPMFRKMSKHYDIIHIHQPDPIAILALLFSDYSGKIVTHWHADIAEYPLLQKLYNPLPNWLLKHSDIIIATTPITAEASRCLKPFKNKIAILPIGIKDPLLQPELAEIIRKQYTNKKIIFSMGRLATYKGFNFLIDAMKELSEDYVCLIGGKGPLFESLQEQISSLGLDHKVKLLGFLTNEEVSSLYDACTLFCMPSINKGEAFGIVQIEGMAHSKPIIATKIKDSGVPWVNIDGVTGINVEPSNAHEIAKAILQIAENDELKISYGRNARKRFEAMFTREIMVKKCVEIYKSIS
jgi:glycosyltransferase involved in cell wall biosynthesis